MGKRERMKAKSPTQVPALKAVPRPGHTMAAAPAQAEEKPIPLDVDVHIRVRNGQIGFPDFSAPSLDVTYDLAAAILEKAKNQIMEAKGRLVLRPKVLDPTAPLSP